MAGDGGMGWERWGNGKSGAERRWVCTVCVLCVLRVYGV